MENRQELYLDLLDEIYYAYAHDSWLSMTTALQGLYKEIAREFHGKSFDIFKDRNSNHISEKSAINAMFGLVQFRKEFERNLNSSGVPQTSFGMNHLVLRN